jgi:5-hmdU DNA kinase-like protein
MECCRPIPQIARPVTTSPEYLIPDSRTPESSTSGPAAQPERQGGRRPQPGRVRRAGEPGRRAARDRAELADRRTPARPVGRPVISQPRLWADQPGPSRAYRVAGRVVRARAGVFDAFWRFAAERQAVFHRRAAGEPPPWTSDPVLAARKFTNVYLSGRQPDLPGADQHGHLRRAALFGGGHGVPYPAVQVLQLRSHVAAPGAVQGLSDLGGFSIILADNWRIRQDH